MFSRVQKIANKILADVVGEEYEYIYDPEHKNRPDDGRNWVETEEGWSTGKKEMGETEWEGYQEFHPDAKKDDYIIVPDKIKEVRKKLTPYQQKKHDKIHHPDRNVRSGIAGSFATHPYTLHELSDDEDVGVRRRIAQNPNTSKKTLRKLSQDKSEGVRTAVASHPNTPQKILKKMSRDENPKIREEVAVNPSTHPKLLEKLSNDEDMWVRKAVAYNRSAPRKILERLSQEKHTEFEAKMTLSMIDRKNYLQR